MCLYSGSIILTMSPLTQKPYMAPNCLRTSIQTLKSKGIKSLTLYTKSYDSAFFPFPPPTCQQVCAFPHPAWLSSFPVSLRLCPAPRSRNTLLSPSATISSSKSHSFFQSQFYSCLPHEALELGWVLNYRTN